MKCRDQWTVRVTSLLAGAILLGCSDGHDHSVPSWRVRHSAVESYDVARDKWQREELLPRTLGQAQGVVVGDHLYIVSGEWAFSMFLRLDLVTGQWETLPDLPRQWRDHACVALGEEIYVMGGSIGEEVSVQAYSTRHEVWSAGPDLSGERDECEAAVLDGRIYLVAGDRVTEPHVQCTLDVLDPGVGAWQALSPMPAWSRSLAMGSDGSSLYVVADGDPRWEAGALWIYDPGADTWGEGPHMPATTGGYVEGAMVRSLFFVYGNIHEDRRYLLCYDSVRGVWEWVKPMKLKRGHAGLVASDDRIFVIGGD